VSRGGSSRVQRTAQAEQDLIEIWTYIARRNSGAADRLLDVLDRKSRALARDPRMGAARDDIAPGLRHFPAGKYLILYRDLKDGIEVVRYIHGMRRLQELFR
jgi:toxin ParE1/3/4